MLISLIGYELNLGPVKNRSEYIVLFIFKQNPLFCNSIIFSFKDITPKEKKHKRKKRKKERKRSRHQSSEQEEVPMEEGKKDTICT